MHLIHWPFHKISSRLTVLHESPTVTYVSQSCTAVKAINSDDEYEQEQTALLTDFTLISGYERLESRIMDKIKSQRSVTEPRTYPNMELESPRHPLEKKQIMHKESMLISELWCNKESSWILDNMLVLFELNGAHKTEFQNYFFDKQKSWNGEMSMKEPKPYDRNSRSQFITNSIQRS